MKCYCEDWEEGIKALNAPFLFMNARNPGTGDYKGKPFLHCPWCGCHLHEEKKETWTPQQTWIGGEGGDH